MFYPKCCSSLFKCYLNDIMFPTDFELGACRSRYALCVAITTHNISPRLYCAQAQTQSPTKPIILFRPIKDHANSAHQNFNFIIAHNDKILFKSLSMLHIRR